MIRKYSAILFLLVANITFLAHAVLPHHHHDKEVCFVDSHCQNNSEAHEHVTATHNHKQHDTREQSHEHDGNTETQNCLLKLEVIIPSNQFNLDCLTFNYIDNPNFIGFKADLFDTELILQNRTNISIKIPPLILSNYYCFVATSKGLRAPPIV